MLLAVYKSAETMSGGGNIVFLGGEEGVDSLCTVVHVLGMLYLQVYHMASKIETGSNDAFHNICACAYFHSAKCQTAHINRDCTAAVNCVQLC